ncbi:unnamed protein product [Tuber aestivum]|uniref:Major facilitator superfamily (MFS) profile domain-containing protein n=1 Tax=Tuber aestivum TaxID=59557 RepID=A0A292PQG2_9PEZI|nr:unnamed protein product [Tuber aestivum]
MTDLMTPDRRTSFTLHSPPGSPSPPSPSPSPSTPSTFLALEVPNSDSSPSYIMQRLREWWKPTYEPLEDQDEREDMSLPRAQRVSRFEYFVFLSLGVAMLWSWNMFMACATYFQRRFAENEFLLNNFQSLILAVSSVTNLGSTLYLSYRQKSANYPWRICASLVINCGVFTMLALSAVMFRVGPEAYVVVLLTCVFWASWSSGLSQNGMFAFVNKFDGIYTQAVMTGQGVAGVLPAIAQIISVLAVPRSPGTQGSTASPKSAFIYFLTATFVSGSCLLLFLLLLSRHRISPHKSGSEAIGSQGLAPATHTQVSLWVLLKKLRFLSFAVWLCFLVTMVFPVYTQVILSVRPEDSSPRMFKPDVFIPIGFMLWNLGDLTGRVICGWRRFTCDRPKLLALVSIARLAFIPLYMMCNIKGHGAVISSDLFYWLVQFTFGMSNGWVGSNVMMSTPGWVGDDEKEASGGFMGMCLVAGLATGSLTSFLIANV